MGAETSKQLIYIEDVEERRDMIKLLLSEYLPGIHVVGFQTTDGVIPYVTGAAENNVEIVGLLTDNDLDEAGGNKGDGLQLLKDLIDGEHLPTEALMLHSGHNLSAEAQELGVTFFPKGEGSIAGKVASHLEKIGVLVA